MQIELNENMSSVNPYRNRIEDFPGRLFSFQDESADRQHILQLAKHAGNIFIELGSGSGQHLIKLAQANPEASFFGFELRYKRAVRTVEKANLIELENIYVLRTDAFLMADFFNPGSVDGIYVNFPDPWEKRKRWKHRILGIDFLKNSELLLKQNGFISVKTDHLDYFKAFLKSLGVASTLKIAECTNDLYNSSFLSGNTATEFENLFKSLGQPICYCKLIK